MNGSAHPFRVVLIGAGAIAEHHALALAKLQNTTLAGFIDNDVARARERADKFGVKTYASLQDAADDGVNVAHILTPPASHAPLALACIERGMHVLVEKPLATSVAECETIRDAAAARGVMVSVDHSLLFDPEIKKALDLVRAGAIGEVVSVDILRSSEYPSFAGGRKPPHYGSPGEPFRDLGVHALYLLREFLGEIRGATPKFRSLGGDPLLSYDEWFCMVDCERGYGSIRLSWNVRPLQNLIIVQGTAGVLRADVFHMFVSLRRNRPLPKAVVRIISTITDSVRPLFEMPKNTLLFALKKRRQYHGIHGLVADFYSRLEKGEGPTVTVRDGTEAVRWMDIVAREADSAFVSWNDQHPLPAACDVLVTGGAGKLGSAIVEGLVAEGKSVRVLARKPPAKPLPANVQYVVGDLGDPEVVDYAMRGIGAVVHAGAVMGGDWNKFLGGTIVGTRNVLDSMQRHGVRRLVHVSSLSVVDWAGSDKRGPVDESTDYEPRADLRGYYTQSKLDAERMVRAAAEEGKVHAIVLRPGQIFGRSQPVLTPAVMRRIGGLNLVLGNGRLCLPLVHVDDIVAAVSVALKTDAASGTVVQLVDPVRYTQNDVLRICRPPGMVLRLPRPFVFFLGWVSERLLGLMGRQSPFSVYRLKSALARLEFESTAGTRLLGWQPAVGAAAGLESEARRSRP